MISIRPVTEVILSVLQGWLPPDDLDMDDPRYLVDCAARIARTLNPVPTDDPRRWTITLPDEIDALPQ